MTMPTKEELARVIYDELRRQAEKDGYSPYVAGSPSGMDAVCIDGDCDLIAVAEAVLARLTDRTP